MTDAIRFLLNGEDRTVSGAAPTTTVLEYLRAERLCGTKEGCAEGDCGACTVVLAEPDGNGGLAYRAVNSCIKFLPTLDGRQLITVEGLKAEDGALHPVQQAMVDCHASQCGFCTPGFVMSLFALWHTSREVSRADAIEALAGNLCRCTGYRPILDAAQQMHRGAASDRFDAAAPAIVARLERLSRLTALRYAAAGGEFLAPRSLDELQTMLRQFPAATILAGGTDLGLAVTKQHRDFERLLWLGELAELRAIAATETHLEIGAGAAWTDALPALTRYWPELGEFVRRFASPPIRNAATIGGNIANASPIGDGPPVLLALGTSIVLLGPDGEREVPLDDFFTGYRKTGLRPGEIAVRLRVPLPQPGMTFAAYKLSKRFDQDISAVCAAFAVRIDNGVATEARLAFGGMAALPLRARQAEAAIAGKPWTAVTIQTAAVALERDFTPIDDMRASAAYRMRTARNLLQRFLLETQGAAEARIANG